MIQKIKCNIHSDRDMLVAITKMQWFFDAIIDCNNCILVSIQAVATYNDCC